MIPRLLFFLLLLQSGNVGAETQSSDYDGSWQQYASGLLQRSIPYVTIHGNDDLLKFARLLADEFLDNGFSSEEVRLLPMISDGTPSAALVVRYPGNSTEKPILFSGHMDVVPASGEWERDPFELVEANGFFYGRGVLDNKYATTVLTTTFLRLRAEDFVPERDLVIAFTGDEETKMLTVRELVREHRDLVDAEIAFVPDSKAGLLDPAGKPAALLMQYAEKTYMTLEITARNSGGHSSLPRPDNAIYALADAIRAIRNLQFPVQRDSGTRAYFDRIGKIVGGEPGAAMRQFAADPSDQEALAVLLDTPEYAVLLRTTCVPTMVDGGHVENALPESATVTVNCRLYPGVTADSTEARLVAAIDNPELEIERTWDPVPGVASPVRQDVVTLLSAIARRRDPGIVVVPHVSTGATDSKFLRLGGIDAYGVMGFYMTADGDRSHSNNERLPVGEFYRSLDFWYALMQAASAL